MLLHSPEEIVAKVLISEGVGVAVVLQVEPLVWPISVSYVPDQPDNVIVVTGTNGRSAGRTAPDKKMREYYGIQLMIRAGDHQTMSTKMYSVADVCDQLLPRTITIDSTEYLVHTLSRTAPPLPIGQEQGKSARRLGTINLLATIQRK